MKRTRRQDVDTLKAARADDAPAPAPIPWDLIREALLANLRGEPLPPAYVAWSLNANKVDQRTTGADDAAAREKALDEIREIAERRARWDEIDAMAARRARARENGGRYD